MVTPKVFRRNSVRGRWQQNGLLSIRQPTILSNPECLLFVFWLEKDNYMKKVWLTTVSILLIGLTGCASAARPFSLNGNYFLAGDKNCARYRELSSNSIMCLDKHGKEIGYRNAMTNQDLQMYMQQQQLAAAQAQAIAAQTQAMINSSTPQPTQPSTTYTPPQVQPITPPGGNQTRCITTGNITNCRTY